MAKAKKKVAPKPVAKKAAAPAADKDAARKAKEKEATAANKAKEVKAVGKLRSQGLKWPEIAEELGMSIGKAQLLGKIAEAGEPVKATPALVQKARDKDKLSWGDIMVKFGLTKAAAQKMYAESGADPHTSFVGKGGRYFSYEDKVAGKKKAAAKEKAAAAPAKPKAAPKTAKQPSTKGLQSLLPGGSAQKAPKQKATPAPKVATAPAPAGKPSPVFGDEATADEIKSKLSGKSIVYTGDLKGQVITKDYKIKADSVKVGKQTDGQRVVQFTNLDTGGTHTLLVSGITKVGK